MNDDEKKQSSHLRSLSSEDAASWLISEFSLEKENYSEAIKLITHRSWKKSDQLKLANYYFGKIPFANGRAYELFFLSMSLSVLISAIRNNLPSAKEDLDLLNYHLSSLLKKYVKNEKDKKIAEKLLKELVV